MVCIFIPMRGQMEIVILIRIPNISVIPFGGSSAQRGRGQSRSYNRANLAVQRTYIVGLGGDTADSTTQGLQFKNHIEKVNNIFQDF